MLLVSQTELQKRLTDVCVKDIAGSNFEATITSQLVEIFASWFFAKFGVVSKDAQVDPT